MDIVITILWLILLCLVIGAVGLTYQGIKKRRRR